MRVLIAEDDESTRELLIAFFGSQNVQVASVENGAEALTALRRQPPDILVLDLAMPILSGWDVLRECAADAALAKIPVVVVSALVDVEPRARELGAVDFFLKPVDLDKLLRSIQRHATPSIGAREAIAGDPHHLQDRILTALIRSEQQYRTLMNHASDAIVVLDAQFHCVMANRRASQLFTYSSEEFCRLTYSDLLPPGARTSDGLPTDSSGEPPLVREQEFCRKDGTTIFAETSIAILPDGQIQLLIRDVSERHRIQQHLIQAQKMEVVGRLAGGIAHDFNNLLTAILGYSDLLLEQIDAGKPIWSDLQEIRGAAERAAGLTRQLLAFSRTDTLDVKVVDINSVVRRLEPLLARLAGESIKLSTNLAHDVLAVRADMGQLEQALINLVTNAKDAMPDGGSLRIETANVDRPSSAPVPSFVCLAIIDSGCGMDAATQARIFEPFFTTKTAGTGTGLGLATIRSTMVHLGGKVEVASEVGRGSSFRLYFPASAVAAAAEPPAERTGAPVGVERILVVDDDDSVRTFVTKVLARHGYHVLGLSGSEEAIVACERSDRPLDLLVTDIIMPHMDGRALAGHLTSLNPGLSVIFMTGYSGTRAAPEGEGVLHKPFTSRELLRRVRDKLDRRLTNRSRTVSVRGAKIENSGQHGRKEQTPR